MKTFDIRLIGFATVVFIFSLSCSESGREINSEQLELRRDDLYYAVNEEKPYSGKVVEFYESGQKQTERSFKNGKLHGLTTEWDSDGQKRSEVGYEGSVQSGPYRTWYTNGQQEKEGAYKDGKEDGKWVFWYENGQKRKEGRYKNGKREGKWDLWTKNGEKIETGEVTDIDGNTYLTVKIGEQWWMAENLKVTRYRNDDAIPNITDNEAWAKLSTGAYCDYDNSADSAATYGHLYNGYAVNDPRGLTPEGWHIPSDAEWQTLVDYLGGSSVAGGKMKETVYWAKPNTDATNESGFSALPGGYRDTFGSFDYIGYDGYFWSATDLYSLTASTRYLLYYYYSETPGFTYSHVSKKYGFSVRCVRD